MHDAQIETTVQTLVAQLCGIAREQVQLDSYLVSCGLDSVRAMDLLSELEHAFALPIPDEVALRVRTVRDLCGYVQNALEAHGARAS